MTLSLLFLFNFFCIYYIGKRSKFNIWQPFIIINFNAILALIIGGDLSLITRPYHYSSGLINYITFSIFNIPVILILSTALLFGNRIFGSSIYNKLEIESIQKFVNKAFKPFLIIYPIVYAINFSLMLTNNTYLRAYYQYAIEQNFGLLYNLSTISGVFFTLHWMIKKKYLLTLIGVLSLITLGKKSPILLVILLPLIYEIVQKPKLNFKVLSYVVLGIACLLFLGKSFTKTDITVIEQLASTLDYYYNFGYFLEKYPLGIDNGQIFLTSFYLYIPRLVWSAKPHIYGFLLIHEKLFYKEMEINFYPSVFEEYATYIADFGLIGGIIAIVFIKTFLYFLLMNKRISMKLKIFLVIGAFDPTVAIAIVLLYIYFEKYAQSNNYRLP